jgi:hypothetical protein
LSRIASDYALARRRYAGGFSLGIWTYQDKNGLVKRNPYRPRVAVKYIDSKRALVGFTGRQEPDAVDLIPEGSTTGKPEEDYIFRGHFLDLNARLYEWAQIYAAERRSLLKRMFTPKGKDLRREIPGDLAGFATFR